MTDHDALVALSPLDGRYAGQAEALRAHFSEFGLIRSRVRVELAWLAALSDEPGVPEVPPFDAAAFAAQRAEALDRLRQQKAGRLFQSLVQRLRSEARIEVNRELMARFSGQA